MSENLKKMEMAVKMRGRRSQGFGHGDKGLHRHRMTKGFAEDFFRAKVDKQKLPKISHRGVEEKDPKYARLTLPEFLKKYPEWKP